MQAGCTKGIEPIEQNGETVNPVSSEQLLNDVVMLLCRCISLQKLYFEKHPQVMKYQDELKKNLDLFFKTTGQEKLFLGLVDKSFIYEGKKLIGPSVVGKQFMLTAEMLCCGGITFIHPVAADELKRFLKLAVSLREPLASLNEARQLLQQNGIEAITLAHEYEDTSAKALAENKEAWQGRDTAGLLESPTLVYQALFDMVSRAHGAAAVQNSIDMENAMAVSEFMLQYISKQFSDIMQHIVYPDYDNYTIGHSVRVAALAVYSGMQFGWDHKYLLDVGRAALLHDIGKSRISGDILFKHGPLNAEERYLIEQHCRTGAEILLSHEDATPLDIAAAWGHHLRYDGKGYPPQPDFVPLHPITALLHICDVFEALTAVRPYKEAMVPKEAYTIMLRDKGSFHPSLLTTFIKIVGLYPPGTIVTLSDKRTATVIGSGAEIDRPTVRVIRETPDSEELEQHADTLDLSHPEYQGLSITSLELEY